MKRSGNPNVLYLQSEMYFDSSMLELHIFWIFLWKKVPRESVEASAQAGIVAMSSAHIRNMISHMDWKNRFRSDYGFY